MLTRAIDVGRLHRWAMRHRRRRGAGSTATGWRRPMPLALATGALAGAFNGLLVGGGCASRRSSRTPVRWVVSRGDAASGPAGKWIEGLPGQPEIARSPRLSACRRWAGWCWRCCWRAAGCCRAPTLVVIFTLLAITPPPRANRGAANRTRMLAFTPTVCWRPAPDRLAAQIGFVPNQTGSGLEMKPSPPACWAGSAVRRYRYRCLAFLGAFSSPPKSTPHWCCSAFPPGWNDFIAGSGAARGAGARWPSASGGAGPPPGRWRPAVSSPV